MRDNGHPLAKCPVEVLQDVVSDEQANALIAMAEVSEKCGKGDGDAGARMTTVSHSFDGTLRALLVGMKFF